MILVDSSVWIDDFNGVATRETDLLDGYLGSEPLLTGGLLLTEESTRTATSAALGSHSRP